MNKTFIGNCVSSFDENGVCVNPDLPWRDVTEFAQAVEANDNTRVGQIEVRYNPMSDIHDFWLIA